MYLPQHEKTLTIRERAVLSQVADGFTNRAIAHHLRISETTVKEHVRTIRHKLKTCNRTHTAVVALRLGLIT